MKTAFPHQLIIIGAGNVATRLGIAFYQSGVPVAQVYNRNFSSAKILAKKIKASPINDLQKISLEASIIIIAVKDDAIPDIVKKIPYSNQLIVHTSGTTEMNSLKRCSANIGVLYPLQTFSKSKKVDFSTIPVCIESNNAKSVKLLKQLAKQISTNVRVINSNQRKIVHIAAVFACNFTNHMYAIAHTILKEAHLPFDLLKPLIQETAGKIMHNDPYLVQTGPAKRKDKKTMNEHLKLLSADKQLKALYKLISNHIATS